MSPGTGLRERTSEAISKVDSGVAICGGGVQSHQWEEDRDHAAWGGGGPHCVGDEWEGQ